MIFLTLSLFTIYSNLIQFVILELLSPIYTLSLQSYLFLFPYFFYFVFLDVYVLYFTRVVKTSLQHSLIFIHNDYEIFVIFICESGQIFLFQTDLFDFLLYSACATVLQWDLVSSVRLAELFLNTSSESIHYVLDFFVCILNSYLLSIYYISFIRHSMLIGLVYAQKDLNEYLMR